MRKLSALFILLLLFATAFNVMGQTPLKMRDASIQGPQTFAIIMGISKYKYVRPLAYADKDAEMFRDYLKSPGGGNVKDENLFCLLNEKAVSSNFWGKGFQWLKAKNLQKGDRLFIYLAGHGDAIDEDQFFFLSYDCNPLGDKNNYLVAGTIQLYNLKKKIAAETTKGVEVFFIMDACRSNELPGGSAGQNFLNTAISEKRVGETIMLATAAGQESLEDVSIGNGHGLFTYYLVDGLTGSAENIQAPDNKITYQEIQSYVNNNVPSVAQQQFKRKQEPYFCCNESSDKVISTIDTAYLSKWLKTKKQQNKGPGNSAGFIETSGTKSKTYRYAEADTTLLQTYELFNKAIANNNLTGQSSAEYYYETMNTKYAGNPYTLDAKSTLAVEFINLAQAKVNQYLGCQTDQSPRQKQEFYEAGLRLERAIKIIGEDDADYAKALMGRMYLLKASGDFGKDGKNGDISVALQHAYAALAIDPNGAYIQNKLAMLHLENNNKDSAMYYASKATKTAPNWACALTTLALIQKAVGQNNSGKNNSTNKKPLKKNSFGVVAGSGVSHLNPTYKDAGNTNIVGVNPKNIIKLDLGIIYQVGIGKNVSLRPSALITTEGGELVYQRRLVTGGQIISDPVKLKNTSVTATLPLLIRLSDKKIAPFISLGPSFSYVLSQNAATATRIPVKKSILMGDAGIGVDIDFAKSRLVLSPEIKYTQGFNNIRDDGKNEFTNTLSSLKKRGVTFSIYLRGR
jgi:tetratricopeptide (TPR) repeat protein